MLDEIRRLSAAIGLFDFRYFLIPAEASGFVLETVNPQLPVTAVPAATLANGGLTSSHTSVMSSERQGIHLSIVKSTHFTENLAELVQMAQPFSLLADVATVVASTQSGQFPRTLDNVAKQTPDAMSRRARVASRVAGVGRR